MKKILLSVLSIALVAGVAIYGTNAFFSDTETSTGNILQAGAIDLGIDNHSYYNGVLNTGTTWRVDYDIEDETPRQFFNFTDVKPGDWGEDTISLRVKDNDSWLCADVTLTADDDNGLTEPEGEDGDTTAGPTGEGELADAITFYWWADDGDNVLEVGETLLPAGPMGALAVGQTATVALADSQNNIWGPAGPLPGDNVRYVGKAWCFGTSAMTPYAQDGGNLGSGPDVRPVVCDGANVNNVTQTDSFTATIAFRAVQSRNNLGFVCRAPEVQRPLVGASLGAYSAPTCTATVGAGQSIQTAVDAASAGSTVCVDPGYTNTDTFPIIINKNLTLAGLGTAGSAVLNGGVRVDANDVTITGLEIHSTNFSGEIAAIYQSSGVDNTVVSYNELMGPGAATPNSEGLINVFNIADPNMGLQFRHNISTGWLRGIFQNPSQNVVIEYNDFVANGVGSANDGPTDNVIRYNDFQDNTLEAVGFNGAVAGNGNLDVNFNNLTATVAAGNDVNHYGGAVLNAENNWWGDNDPSNDVNSGANVDYNPFEASAFPEN